MGAERFADRFRYFRDQPQKQQQRQGVLPLAAELGRIL
jgi:hypothetical protein